MTSLAEVLAFKFPGVEGVRTREKAIHSEPFDPFNDVEIFDWPTAKVGRGVPNVGELVAWKIEYEGRTIEKALMSAEDLWEVLRAKGVVVDEDVPGDRRQPPRRS